MILRFIICVFVLTFSEGISAQLSDFSHLSTQLDRLTTIKIDSSTNTSTSNSIIKRQDYNGFSDQHLGAMCKLENTINRATLFPVAIRLGTVQYVDHMEGKVEEYSPIKK
ncbi:hypothetical protein N9L92_01695 [Saprospiraceae bacterium]|nr:hypothetical protein [Saprospiraceae bacterium]